MKILIADDDSITLDSLKIILITEGYEVLVAKNGVEAFSLWKESRPDLLCLDIMMPQLSGFEVCQKVRQQDSLVPILFLSAKNEEIDIVSGFHFGADDFVRKPFGKRELLARIKKALWRIQTNTEQTNCFQMGDLCIYPSQLRATRANTEIKLFPREISILHLLCQKAGEVVTRDAILNHCWGIDYFPDSRTLDQTISKLRKRIEIDSQSPQLIETIRGMGYRYRPEST